MPTIKPIHLLHGQMLLNLTQHRIIFPLSHRQMPQIIRLQFPGLLLQVLHTTWSILVTLPAQALHRLTEQQQIALLLYRHSQMFRSIYLYSRFVKLQERIIMQLLHTTIIPKIAKQFRLLRIVYPSNSVAVIQPTSHGILLLRQTIQMVMNWKLKMQRIKKLQKKM